jgi:hypothetical protein
MTPSAEAQWREPGPLRCREPYWLMDEIVPK